MTSRAAILLLTALLAALVAGVGCAAPLFSEAEPSAEGDFVEGARDGGAGGAAQSTGLPCDVQAVLEKHCASCHGATPAYGAPFPLVTHSDVTASGRGERILARMKDEARPMPPSPAPRASATDIAALEKWLADGAKPSAEACAGASGESATPKLTCDADVRIRPSRKYAVKKGSGDSYVCYGITVDSADKRHITALGPHIDNKRVVHHLLVYSTPKPIPSEPYDCGLTGLDWKLLMGWAPGGKPEYLPEEAGFVQKAGKVHYAMQIHYNDAAITGDAEEDASGFDLCTTAKLRKYDADALAVGSMSFTIPPGSNYAQTCRYTWGSGSGIPLGDWPSIHVFSNTPHMHGLGERLGTWVDHKAGATEPVGTVGVFDDDDQTMRRASVDVAPGDVLRTTCAWKNPTARAVTFGEGTADEMCFNFLGYYPKVENGDLFEWYTPTAVPSFAFGCSATSE